MRLLYHCDADSGGIAEYALRQLDALADSGATVSLLCRPTLNTDRVRLATVRKLLPTLPPRASMLLGRITRQIADQRSVARIVEHEVESGRYDALLIACFSEYFSPFWARIYRRISKKLPIGTIAHDPLRDFVLGPGWWHRWSIRQAYSFVSDVFVHDATPVDFGGPQPLGIRVHQIPHGPFEVLKPQETRNALRQRYGFQEKDRVFLSFGQIRDGKNLDRFLRVMPRLPSLVKLLVAGSGGSKSQRPPESYQRLAEHLEVADRCAWEIRYIPDEEIGGLFEVADFVLLTYSAKFHSASGVLNTAVACRKPVLASSGAGPLKKVVEDYRLGVFIPPDDDVAILEATRRLITDPMAPEWSRYERENSWDANAKRVIKALRERLQITSGPITTSR